VVRESAGTSQRKFQTIAEVLPALTEILAKVQEDLGITRENSELIHGAVQGFRELTAESKPGSPFDLRTLLQAPQVRSMTGPNVNLSIDPMPSPLRIPGPSGNIADVVQNLVVNAGEAMNGNPQRSITIQTAIVELTEEDKQQLLGFSPSLPEKISGSYVRLRVSDTGKGMDEDTLRRIFEPYFTTKPTGEVGVGNRGLGLAMTLKYVQSVGGFIVVRSAPGTGTTFELYFPQVPEAQKVAVPQLPDWIYQTPTLVVGKEAATREGLHGELQQSGFPRVFHAGSGLEALELIAGHPEIKLIAVDMQLEDMNAKQLLQQLPQGQEAPRVVVWTSFDPTSYRNRFGNSVELMEKPASAQAFLQALQQMLQRHSNGK